MEHALARSAADACIVIGRTQSTASVRWANNTVTNSGVATTASLTIVSIAGRRTGSVSHDLVSGIDVEPLVRRSEAACRYSADAPDYMPLPLPDGEADATDARTATTDAVPADAVATGIHAFETLAPKLDAVFTRARAANLRTFGSAEQHASTIWLATSTGVRRRHADRVAKLTITAKRQDYRESSWTGAAGEDLASLDPIRLLDTLEQRRDWFRREVALPPGDYDVLLEPSCTADLAIAAYGAMTRRLADEGRGPYANPAGGTRIGERMFGRVTMYSDPRERGMPATPFHVDTRSRAATSVFDNGLTASRTEWVRDGVLRSLVTPRHWAARVGAPAVPYINNLIVAGGRPSLDEMIAASERALLITSLWYMRTVDPRTALLTGVTRDGVFLVERGRIVGAAPNFRWNMSATRAFAQAIELGRSERCVPREHDAFQRAMAPPIRVERFPLSTAADDN